MIVEKQVFKLEKFTFEAGVCLPIEIGYERDTLEQMLW